MVEMHVEGLSLDPQTRKPIVILRQNDGKGLLPLWIGAMEAMTISLVLNGEELPRPLAHDLLLMVWWAHPPGPSRPPPRVHRVVYGPPPSTPFPFCSAPPRSHTPLGRHRPGPARLGPSASRPTSLKRPPANRSPAASIPPPGTRPVPMPPPTWPAAPTPARKPTPWPPCWPKAPCPNLGRPPGRNGCASCCGPLGPYRGTRCQRASFRKASATKDRAPGA